VNVGAKKARKSAALGAAVATMLTAALAFGEEPTRCREAYLASGFTQQQMGFEEFRELYSDSICTPGGEGDPAATYYSGKEAE
jgi:hypothetical protein